MGEMLSDLCPIFLQSVCFPGKDYAQRVCIFRDMAMRKYVASGCRENPNPKPWRRVRISETYTLLRSYLPLSDNFSLWVQKY